MTDAPRQRTAAQRRAMLFVPLMMMLGGACSAPADSAAQQQSANDDPAGAALPLSIGGAAQQEGDDPYLVAVHCAAALGLTAERLAQMTNDPASEEIALLGRAQRHFETRAQQAAQTSEAATGSVTAAVGRRRQEKAQETTQQAQLAIACLRRFGDDINTATGADVQL